MQDNIKDEVEHNPYGDIHTQHIGDIHTSHHQEVDQDKHQRQRTDAHHHLSHPQTTSQQLMVDMTLIWQERILPCSQSVTHHSHHVEQRNQHRGKGKHHVVVRHHMRAHIHRAQVNHQETDDVAQRQRTRIAHKELSAPHGISKHVVEPERDNHTQRRNAEQGKGKQMQPDMQPRQSHQRDGTEPRSQTVDAVNQVDGIGNIHHDKHGKRHTEPRRHLIHPEESVERLDPYARSHEQARRQYLHQELLLVPHADEVIGEPHQEEHHATHQQSEVFKGSLPLHGSAFQTHQMMNQHQTTHGNQHHGEERQSAQPWYRSMMHLSLIRHIKQSLLMRDEQNVRQHDIGDDHRHDKGTQQIKMNWLNHISILLLLNIIINRFLHYQLCFLFHSPTSNQGRVTTIHPHLFNCFFGSQRIR